MSAKLEALIAAKEAYTAMVREKGQEVVREVFTDFFNANPNVHSVWWRQYTPYFNDGEACVFNVYDPGFKFVNVEEAAKYCKPGYAQNPETKKYERKTVFDEQDYEEGGDQENGYFGTYDMEGDIIQFRDLAHVLCGVLEDVLSDAFGDHQEITATREGFVAEDYDHE